MIQLDCPCCACALQLPDHSADHVVRCPECEERLRVPAAGLRPAELSGPGERPVRAGGWLAACFVAVLAAVPVIGTVAFLGKGIAGGTDGAVAGQVAPGALLGVTVPLSRDSSSSEATSVRNGGGAQLIFDQAAAAGALEPLR